MECTVFPNPHEKPSPVLLSGNLNKGLTGDDTLSDSKYNDYVDAVVKEIPDASPDEIRAAFEKYENEFYIPPQDAMRSVLRKFQSDGSSTASKKPVQQRQTKKASQFSELQGDDRDVEIEVMVMSHNLRQQMIRGEERQIAFGMFDDLPWEDESKRTRWEYKDWGGNTQITPGSILRLEGASVNEYNGKMSLNVNQSTRIVVLQEGSGVTLKTDDPIDVVALPNDGYVTVVGRVLSTKEDQIHRKDGSGSIDVVRGRIADETGNIGFLSWEPFTHEVGTLIKITGAQVRTFRDTPELNFGRTTRIEPYHDTNFSSTDELKENALAQISDLRDGARDVEIIVQINDWVKRTFEKDGEEKFLWAGQVIDPSGQCRMSAWDDVPFAADDVPVFVKITNARIRAYQGIPDIVVDTGAQISVLEEPPWDGEINPDEHVVDVRLDDVVQGGSRVGLETTGLIVSVRDDSGKILRCTECKRVMRDQRCYEHGEVEGEEDIRIRMVLDGHGVTASLLVNKATTLEMMECSEDELLAKLEQGHDEFLMELRSKFLTNAVMVRGRSIIDQQGAMIIASHVEVTPRDPQMRASELRTAWGWN